MIWFWRAFRPGWHPWLFMLALGTLVWSLVHGDVGVALACLLVAVWAVWPRERERG